MHCQHWHSCKCCDSPKTITVTGHTRSTVRWFLADFTESNHLKTVLNQLLSFAYDLLVQVNFTNKTEIFRTAQGRSHCMTHPSLSSEFSLKVPSRESHIILGMSCIADQTSLLGVHIPKETECLSGSLSWFVDVIPEIQETRI